MADESHMKMEALSKAYAEIILNTSKEAAARVMAAERKARNFEQQLVVLREDSLSMLLRLKQHFTSLIIEAEERSLKQQLKIEELEAQLDEAEGITVDLRGELKQLQEQLDIMRHSQKKTSDEHILVTKEPVQECASQDYVPCVSDSKSALVDCAKKTDSLHPTALSQMFCHSMNSTNLSVKSQLNQSHSPNDDFNSIIMQNRETKLCRNGSTQRIHALDGNLSNAILPNSPYRDQLPHRSSFYKGQGLRSLRRSTRINSRYREAIASLQGPRKKFDRMKKRAFLGPLKGCLSSVNVQAVEIPIDVVDNFTMDPKKIKIGCVPEYNDLSCCRQNTVCAEGENVELPRKVSSDKFHKLPDNVLMDSILVDVPISEGFGSSDCQLADVSLSERFGNSHCQLADVPISEGFGGSNDQFSNVPISEEFGNRQCQLADVSILEGSDNSDCQIAVEDRFLKFTFHRKRRRNVLKTIDGNIPHNRDPLKRRLENPADVPALETVF